MIMTEKCNIPYINRRAASRKEVRRLSEVVSCSRKFMARSLGLAKTLREQLEVAIEYRKSSSLQTLRGVLETTGYAKLSKVDQNHLVFVPGKLSVMLKLYRLLHNTKNVLSQQTPFSLERYLLSYTILNT